MRQVACRADAGQRSRAGTPVRRGRLVGELQREQLLRGDGHQRRDRPHGQEAHLQGRSFISFINWAKRKHSAGKCSFKARMKQILSPCCRSVSERRPVCPSTSPTLSSASTPSGNMGRPRWLLPWSVQTGLPLEVPMPSSLSSSITAG